jgi:hypothetical protein
MSLILGHLWTLVVSKQVLAIHFLLFSMYFKSLKKGTKYLGSDYDSMKQHVDDNCIERITHCALILLMA